MEIIFAPKALNDLNFWKSSGSIKIRKKITALITSISLDPFNGTGKPEPLRHEFAGCWSRRISEEHRIIYEVREGVVEILSLKDHY